MIAVPRGPHESLTRGGDTVMTAQDVSDALVGYLDADVTVAIGATAVDILSVSYDADKEKIVLRLLADDLIDAVVKLARDGLLLG